MKKITKMNQLLLLVALILVFATACSKTEDNSKDKNTEPATDETAEQEAQQPEGEEASPTPEEGTAEPQLQETTPDKVEQEVADEMKTEKDVEDAMAFVTDDGYVLTTFMAEAGMTKEAAEALAKEYGEKLSKKYPDHIIDIEVLQGEDFLTVLTIEPESK